MKDESKPSKQEALQEILRCARNEQYDRVFEKLARTFLHDINLERREA